MKFYDLYVSVGENDLKKIIETAKKIGWNGIGFITNYNNKKSLEKTKAFLSNLKNKLDIVLGVEIQTNKPYMIKKIAKDIRKDIELIFVSGGDLEINAAAVKTPEVDVLLHPWFNRKDPGFNHILAKEAVKNNVSLAFDFNDLNHTAKKTRTRLLSKMLDCAKLVKKYKTPFIISSGAKEPIDLRSAFDLMSFGKVLGFQDIQIKQSLSDTIVLENRKRLSGKWIMPGVELK